jgi:mannosyl-3-phosphoglycerate phosphatase
MAPALVFSDLDGTLLDHETYRYEAALPALNALARCAVPLILASSKTAAEIAPLRAEIGFENCEAVVENGGGLLEPFCQTPSASGTRARLLSAIDRIPYSLRRKFSGISGWTLEQVAERTGLDVKAAARARQRDFSEPGIWSGDDRELAEFVQSAAALGISAVRGGRFLTLSFGGTKADRLLEISRRYRSANGRRPVVLALGDAPNDIAMLKAADKGIIIPNPSSPQKIELCGKQAGSMAYAGSPGPAGWNEAVLQFLAEQGLL